MLQAFMNTEFTAVPSTLLPLLICSLAAYAFSWVRFPLRDTLFLIVIAFLLVPVQVAFIPLLTMFRDYFPSLDLTGGHGAALLAPPPFALPVGILLPRHLLITVPPD